MANGPQGGRFGNGARCYGNRSRGGPRRNGWNRGKGTSSSNLKIYGPTSRRGGGGKRGGDGGRRSVQTRIAKRLETIHPNPGPRKRRGDRNRQQRREYRRKKKYDKRIIKRETKKREKKLKEEGAEDERMREERRRPPKIVTWNVQKTSMRENNRRRLRGIVSFCIAKQWDVVLLTERTSQEEGFFWMGEEEEETVVIHGKKAAVMLIGAWAKDWTEQGSQRWLGNRVAAVKVNHMRLVCGYQPLWNLRETDGETYRSELEEQLRMTRSNEWIVIGGDQNATVGKNNEREGDDGGVTGKYGMGQRNEAGNDLVRWCGENGLAWVNSFYAHNWRGTWCHPARNNWYELDGFIMKKSQMGKIVQKISTILEDAYSDHRPKMMTLRSRNLGQPAIKRRRIPTKPKINWEALQDEAKQKEYERMTEQKVQELDQENDIKWETIATVMTKTALEVCGKKQREVITPWVAGRETQLETLKQGIREAIAEVREKKGTHQQAETEESRRDLEEAIQRRKMRRRNHRLQLRAWERDYWEGIIEEMREAHHRGDYGEMYRTLKKLGMRGVARAPLSRYFTPEEFRDHFAKVSQHEFEKDADSWSITLAAIEDRTTRAENEMAAQRMDETPTSSEIWKAIKEMKDKAPGEDEVRISYVKLASKAVQRYVVKTVQRMFDTEPQEWEEMVGQGLVIPLFKKGNRKDCNNDRGVCLLQMGSRILARVLATRIRKWADEMKLVDDNQQGFRSGRSTMDATQMMIRIQEEVSEVEKDKRALNLDTSEKPDDPGAVLLDITKAYPRVNRPAMWTILEKAGMKERCLKTVRGIHEKTVYKVKGRVECSTTWTAERGLREGCATSPALFNIYHAEVMRQVKRRREEECGKQGREPGVQWMHIPGSSLPPKSTNKAMRSSDAVKVRTSEVLFADDTTIIGTRSELEENVKIVKETMDRFEEKCHEGKEEWIYFGKEGSGNVRMLGTWLGRNRDLKERLTRGNRAWWTLKKRLRGTTVSKKTQAKIVEGCIESTMLFDCAARPWMKGEIKKMQQQIDKCYRYIWMDKKGGPGLRQMEAAGVNMYDIRKELEMVTINTKIVKRCLERMGHVTRMEDERMTKKVVLGWLKKDTAISGRKSRKNTTMTFWRGLLRQAGIDADIMERKATDRKTWRTICQEDTKRRITEEESKCKRRVETAQDQGGQNGTGTIHENICDWPGCDKRFEKKLGLVQHQRIKHKRLDMKFVCANCGQSFEQKGNLSNHVKSCTGIPSGQCPWCQKAVSKSNMARHIKGCRRNPGQETRRQENTRRREEQEEQDQQEAEERRNESMRGEDRQAQRQQEGRDSIEQRRIRVPRWPCCVCGDGVRSGVKCTETARWCHYRCAKVKYAQAKRWKPEEVNEWKRPRH